MTKINVTPIKIDTEEVLELHINLPFIDGNPVKLPWDFELLKLIRPHLSRTYDLCCVGLQNEIMLTVYLNDVYEHYGSVNRLKQHVSELIFFHIREFVEQDIKDAQARHKAYKLKRVLDDEEIC